MNDEKVTLKCVVCHKTILVHPKTAELMKRIGVITCGGNCALKWVERND
jgi:hypothetical protein